MFRRVTHNECNNNTIISPIKILERVISDLFIKSFHLFITWSFQYSRLRPSAAQFILRDSVDSLCEHPSKWRWFSCLFIQTEVEPSIKISIYYFYYLLLLLIHVSLSEASSKWNRHCLYTNRIYSKNRNLNSSAAKMMMKYPCGKFLSISFVWLFYSLHQYIIKLN